MYLRRLLASFFCILLIALSFHHALGQIEFFRYPGNPVLKGTQEDWDSEQTIAPCVLKEGEMHFMWYAGGYTGYPEPATGIGYATSIDGKNWQKYEDNPILTRSGSWASNGISDPSVIQFGSTYYMAYSGTNGLFWRIGMATSPDKVTWTHYSGNPVFAQGEFGEWDDQGVWGPMVIFDGTEFKMYYTGYDGSRHRIGLATSTDGLTWSRVQNNPVLTEGPSVWDSLGVAGPYVIFDDAAYYMWYGGYAGVDPGDNPHYNIGFAVSRDGYQWSKVNSLNPMLRYGEQWFDQAAVFRPSVVQIEDVVEIWFTGWEGWLGGYDTGIGLARSVPLWLDVTPLTTEIPAGSNFDFSVMVMSTSTESVAFQLWSDVILPNGNSYSGNPVLGPEDLEVGPNGTFSANFSLPVPEQAPPNSGYRLTTGVGNYPRDMWDVSRIEFEILPPE